MKTLRWVALLALFGAATPLPAQPLTLREAIARADDGAFQNRIAAGTASAQRAQRTATLRGILPSVRLEGGFVRTDDPIGVFGTALRQRSVTQADFDPARLNFPAAINNYQGGVVVEQPLLNADAWAGRRAAGQAAAASGATAEWTRAATRVEVVGAYYGATLARERVATLSASALAARAHLSQAEAMVRAGLATRSDALLASVGAGEVDAQLADAEAESRTAVRRLAVVLGETGSFAPELPDHLPSAAAIRAVVATVVVGARGHGDRADVEAAGLALEAARLDAMRARSLYLPRLNAFARYDWSSATRLYGGDAAWTVGVMATWTPFSGASEIAEMRAADGREHAARATADAARERALLEAEQAGNAVHAALARLEIAERSVEQAAEAHRIVARKYEGGLATVSELLDAAAMDTRSALALSAARHAAITAVAEQLLALGRDPGALTRLDADVHPIPPSR